jgi:hypothetical protein
MQRVGPLHVLRDSAVHVLSKIRRRFFVNSLSGRNGTPIALALSFTTLTGRFNATEARIAQAPDNTRPSAAQCPLPTTVSCSVGSSLALPAQLRLNEPIEEMAGCS